jgi:DNA-binding transcriptional MerR regulator
LSISEQLLQLVLSLQDLERSLAAQKTLLQQQQETEVESLELQEFLQAEKLTLGDALRDAEAEVSSWCIICSFSVLLYVCMITRMLCYSPVYTPATTHASFSEGPK